MKRWLRRAGQWLLIQKPGDSRNGFTLVEILVVIVIVAILAALLFPQVKKMIESAQKATCMSNMRQLGIAAHLFAAENSGFLPWAGISSAIRWETQIAPYLPGYTNTWSKNQTNWRRNGPFTCPSTAKNYWLGYGWNYDGLGMSPPANPMPPGKTPYDYSRSGPTRSGDKGLVVMLADSLHAYDTNIALGEVDMIYGPPAGMKVPRPHNDGLNTLFADCHAEWHPADVWYTNTRWK